MKVHPLLLLTLALTSLQPAFGKEQAARVAGKDKAHPTTTFGYEVALEAKKSATTVAPSLPGYEIAIIQPSEAKNLEAPSASMETQSAPAQPELRADEKTWLTNLTEVIDVLIALLSGNQGSIDNFKTQLETIKSQAEVAKTQATATKNQTAQAKADSPAAAKTGPSPSVPAPLPTATDQALVFQRAFECVSQAVLQAKVSNSDAGLKLRCEGATAGRLHALLIDRSSEKADANSMALRGSKTMHCWKEQAATGEAPILCSIQLKMGRNFANASASANVPVRFADPTLDHTSLCIHEAAKAGSFTMENGVLILTCRGQTAESFLNFLSTSRPVRVETFPTRGSFESYYVGDHPSTNATVCRYQTRAADGTFPRSNLVTCQVTIDVNSAF